MKYSLDQLRADTTEKHDFEIALSDGQVVSLRGGLRLPDEDRDQIEAIGVRFDELNTEARAIEESLKAKPGNEVRPSRVKKPVLRSAKDVEKDLMDVVRDQFRILADDKTLVEMLIEEIGTDKALLLHILHAYNEQTQAGEASPSQD